ncbi:MAG: Rieske 2Fe-2S domain-containing protein [Planctomycetaceae bacterium]
MSGKAQRTAARPAAVAVDRSPDDAPQPTRRSFMERVLAILIGGFVTLFPFAAGLAVFADPLRKKASAKGSGRDEDGFLRISASLDSLQANQPERFVVIDDLFDAWNIFPDEPIGAVYLTKTGDTDVRALSATCPHAGCPVGFDREGNLFRCPCHDSSFQPDGEIANPKSPAPRGMDPLVVKIKNGTEIWVKFEKFRGGINDRIQEA